MAHGQRQGLADVLLPLLQRLAGQSVDEVDAQVVDAGALQMVYGLLHLPGAVAAVEESQHPVVEGLHSHAHAVDAQRFKGLGVGRRYVVGVGLQRHLGIGAEAPCRGDGLEYAPQLIGRECGGRAAADVDGAQCPAVQEVLAQPHLMAKRLGVGLPLVGAAGGGVEVAVYAAALAKGHVNV